MCRSVQLPPPNLCSSWPRHALAPGCDLVCVPRVARRLHSPARSARALLFPRIARMRHVRLALAAASQVFSPPVLRFVWLDLFCTSQHATFSRPPQWWQQVFSSAIATFGRVVMVMAPWDAPITLTRTWCIFELWACYSNRCRFDMSQYVQMCKRKRVNV